MQSPHSTGCQVLWLSAHRSAHFELAAILKLGNAARQLCHCTRHHAALMRAGHIPQQCVRLPAALQGGAHAA